MNRPILACALFAFASAALCAQQQSSPYSGTSSPPPDDTIESSEPQQPQPLPKPNAGKPLSAQPAAPQTPPASAPSAVQPGSPNSTDPNDGTDAGIVQVAPSASAAATPAQPSVAVQASASDPDGDIVHPAPLPPGVIGEGSTIRVHLLNRLNTTETQKGTTFRTQVASDVIEGGQVIIPTGAEIDGRVVDVSSGRIGGRGSMRLLPETVIMPSGSRYHLDAYVTGAPGSHVNTNREGTIGAEARITRGAIEYGGAIGAGAIAGAVMGGAAGALAGTLIGAGVVTVHLLVTHPQANLEPGSVLLFTLTRPLNLTPVTVASN
jgi:hypothetical protein